MDLNLPLRTRAGPTLQDHRAPRRKAAAQMQTPDLVGVGRLFLLGHGASQPRKALAMTYFLTGNPQYHRRGVVSRSCSGWEGVVPTRYGRQEFGVVVALVGGHALVSGRDEGFGCCVLPRRLWGAHRLQCSLQSYRVKPHGQLVPVSSRRYRPCTPGLSTSWSRTTLEGDHLYAHGVVHRWRVQRCAWMRLARGRARASSTSGLQPRCA